MGINLHKGIFLSKKIFIFSLGAFLSFQSFAQPGAIDTTFNPTDIGYGSGDGIGGAIYTALMQNDGKIIIGGNFGSYNKIKAYHIARLNVNGLLDTTFNTTVGANNDILTTAIQSDGKIIIGGDFTLYNGTTRVRIARLNTNGSLDTTFNVGTGANGTVRASAIQSDGKIIIGGSFTSYNGITVNRIARLNASGSLDTSFSIGAGANNDIYCISIQSDGKIIAGGDFGSYNGTTANRIVRINVDGSLDTMFATGAGTNNTVYGICIQGDGKIILGGYFTSYNGLVANGIIRLNADGSPDTTFNTGAGTNYVSDISIQNDGKIIIGGSFTSYNGTVINGIARLNADGSLDNTFQTGTGAKNSVYAIMIQSDRKIIIAGALFYYNDAGVRGITRLNADGSRDTTFNTGTGANSDVLTTAIQSNEKIIIGGDFTLYNGTTRVRIARLNTDGSLDLTFNPGTGANNRIQTISIQNGKIIIGGQFSSYNGTALDGIVRLNTNGSLDNTFNTGGSGASGTVNTISIQTDGKIIIGGNFLGYNGTGRGNLARLNFDGSLDNTFSGSAGDIYASVFTTSMQKDGKIIIGGDFTTYYYTARNYIARLNEDGTLDNTFNVGTGASSTVSTSIIQNDGKIIIGGYFTSYNGTLINRIARINTDGSLDTTFNPGTGANGGISSILLQLDGKIIIGGGFTSFNGTARNYIARLNADGSLDMAFNPGTGASGIVYTTSIQSDGKIIIGGQFISYNGTGRNRIARIMGGDLVMINNISPTCFGQCDGAATANSFFGRPPYTYLWNNGQTTQTITGLCAGTYSVTASDSAGITKSTSVNIAQPAALTASYTITDASSCTANDGSIKANPSGGVFPYTYLWSNGQTTQTISGLTANIFSVTIIDSKGCTHVDSVVVGCSSGIVQYYNEYSINIFPNPSTGIFTIKSSDPSAALRVTSIEIINVLGEKVYSSSNLPGRQAGNPRLTSYEIDLRKQPKGIYFYKIEGENKNTAAGKIIIE
jgi:uncharacterized delta-60 repeat protein